MPIRLETIYSQYASSFPNRVADTEFDTTSLRSGYSVYVSRFPDRSPDSQNTSVAHINLNRGGSIFEDSVRYNSSNRYGDNRESRILGYITRKGKTPIVDQYSKFNLRQDSPGNLEPLILRGIQKQNRDKKRPQRYGFNGVGTVLERFAEDVARTGKFLASQRGIQFTLNQGILQTYRITAPYKSNIELTNKFPFVQVGKPNPDFRVPVASGGMNNKQLSDFIPPVPGVGILDTGKQDSYAKNVSRPRKTIKEILNNKYTDAFIDEIYTTDLGYRDIITSDKFDLIPIGFDRLQGRKAAFRGVLLNIDDSFTPEWSGYKYLNRPDKVWSYQGVDRTITAGFTIYCNNPDQLYSMYRRLDFLSKLTMPEMTDLNRMKSPLVRFTVGELYKDVLGYVSSLQITPRLDIPWDLGHWDDAKSQVLAEAIDRGALPVIADVNFSMMVIGDDIPREGGNWLSYSDNNFLKVLPSETKGLPQDDSVPTDDTLSNGRTELNLF